MFKIAELQFVAQGKDKMVYNHPEDSNKVIKVMKRSRATENGSRPPRSNIKNNRHQGIYREFRREMIQYLQLCKNTYAKNQFVFPVETVYGFQPTDQGLGLVVEKVLGPNGKLLTAYDLIVGEEFTNKHTIALKRFFDDCCKYQVVFSEVNLRGLMYTELRQNRPEFVMVDGMGEKVFVPWRSMSRSINSYNVRKVEARLKANHENLIQNKGK